MKKGLGVAVATAALVALSPEVAQASVTRSSNELDGVSTTAYMTSTTTTCHVDKVTVVNNDNNDHQYTLRMITSRGTILAQNASGVGPNETRYYTGSSWVRNVPVGTYLSLYINNVGSTALRICGSIARW